MSSKALARVLFGLLLVATPGAVACGGGEAPSGSDPSAEAPPRTSLKLYVFECGRIRVDTLERFSIGDDETDVRELVVPCYIVDHPDGRMLWDGGLPSAIAETDGWEGNTRLDRTLAEQLAEHDLGFDLGSLDYAAFSHIHYDHIGVANEVTGATWLVQQGDFDAAFADPVTVPAVQPELYQDLRDADRLILNGDHDVFGDGRVRLISAPGHTPGHQVLFLDLADTGPLVLSGDLYHFRISREDRRVPTFNVDAQMTLESMARVEAFVAARDATFWIEHDLALFETLRTAPQFYD